MAGAFRLLEGDNAGDVISRRDIASVGIRCGDCGCTLSNCRCKHPSAYVVIATMRGPDAVEHAIRRVETLKEAQHVQWRLSVEL